MKQKSTPSGICGALKGKVFIGERILLIDTFTTSSLNLFLGLEARDLLKKFDLLK